MTAMVFAALAGLAACGALLTAAGLGGRTVLPDPRDRLARVATTGGTARLAGAAGAGLLAAVVTGWLAAAGLAVAGVWFGPTLLGGRAAREASVARTEAIASWTEMVRDSIAAASGLEEAITATGPVAPRPIAPEVSQLVRRLQRRSLPDALTAFREDVAHPSADLVVAALTIAARMEASDLTGLLSRLAESIRGEARMRIRVEVGRARVRTASKVILGVVAATIALLAVLNREYLEVYASPGGQLMLLAVGGIFALGGWLLHRMAALDLPDRFSARARPGSEAQ